MLVISNPGIMALLAIPRPAGFNRTWVRLTYRLGGLIGSADLRHADSAGRTFGRPKVRPKVRNPMYGLIR